MDAALAEATMSDLAVLPALPALPVPAVSPIVRAVASADELASFHREVTDFCDRHLVEGRDYGIIPGTGKKAKPSLLKPGAEKLAFAFGVYPKYELLASEADHFASVEWEKSDGRHGVATGLYRYVVRCSLVRRQDGAAVAEGVGSCSTLEAKYCDRPREVENTTLKMAQKRALVAAVLNGLALSDRFTQDLEHVSTIRAPEPAQTASAETLRAVARLLRAVSRINPEQGQELIHHFERQGELLRSSETVAVSVLCSLTKELMKATRELEPTPAAA